MGETNLFKVLNQLKQLLHKVTHCFEALKILQTWRQLKVSEMTTQTKHDKMTFAIFCKPISNVLINV